MFRSPQIRVGGLGAFCVSVIMLGLDSTAAWAADPWSIWDRLVDLSGHQLGVAFLDGRCAYGTATVSGDDFVLNTPQVRSVKYPTIITKPAQIKLGKAEVLRISEWWSPPVVKDLLYSARSSWSDVGEIATVWREQVSVTTKSGKEIKGKLSEHTQ